MGRGRQPARAGDKLRDRFRLVENIGRGGQGTVWLADDMRLGREVALKQLVDPADPADVERRRRDALREAQALARVNHKNVVTIHDVFDLDGDPWLVMRYVMGKPLRLILESGALSERQVAGFALRVLHGLGAAHRHGVLHRDVKPDNILMHSHNDVVLVDFGTAHVDGVSSISVPHSLVCTPEFTAPERFDGNVPVTAAADLWSLGVTMYVAIEGLSPFRRGGDRPALATMNAVLTAEPPAMHHQGPLAEIIMRLLDKNPGKRPAAAEVEQTLTGLLEPSDARAVRVPLSRPRPSDAGGADRATARPGAESGIPPELSDGAAIAWVLKLPREAAARALRDFEEGKAARIFAQLAEVRPDAAGEILSAGTEAEAGDALSRLTPVLMARVLEAVVAQSRDAGEAVRALRQVKSPLRVAAALRLLPRATAIGLLVRLPERAAVLALQEMDPSAVADLRRDSPGVIDGLLWQTRPSFQAQVARHEKRA